MHRHQLREIAKFCAGLVTGDFLIGAWFISSGRLPLNFLGVTWTLQACLLWMVFDAILVAFLVFYGWHISDKKKTSGEQAFLNVAGVVFAAVAILHLSRLFFGWSFVVGSWAVPYWLNMMGAILALFLSYTSFHFAFAGKK